MMVRNTVLAGILAVLMAIAGQASAETAGGRFSLIDQDGRRVTEASWPGRLRVMTFGYTFCPDVCPTTLGTIAAALDGLGPADGDKVVALFVTVDPGRDTPQHLKAYVAAFHPRMLGLSGTADEIAAAAKQFHVRYAFNPPEGADPNSYSVDHTAGIWIMDGDGRFVARLGQRATVDELVQSLRAHLH